MKKYYMILNVFIAISLITVLSARAEEIALVGGTVIDVSNFGCSHSDIKNAVVIIEGEKITKVGNKHTVNIPEEARIINIQGKYILPGLIDGFAALDNQSFANAYLAMGVTSIVGIEGYRRAPLFRKANPCPHIYNFGFVGKWKVSEKEIFKQIEEWAQKDTKVINLMYELRPYQLKLAIHKSHELGITTFGELGYTSYKEAILFGIDILIHSVRYSLELAPEELKRKVAADPFGQAAQIYTRWLGDLNENDSRIEKYAKVLGKSSVFLMPTLILSCLDLPFVENPWKEPIAKIIDSKDLHDPLEKVSGKHPYKKETLESRNKLAQSILKIEKKYFLSGAKYLAGSGTDVFGTMPGISLHQELELLTRIGLNERQAIAAATSNFSKALRLSNVGQIKPGYRADIIVVDENPLEKIKNLKEIHMIILRGKVLDRDELLSNKRRQ